MTKIIVEADGGSRGNPGIAGAGALIRNEAGEVLGAIAVPLGTDSTNNVAEYEGLIAGLELAFNHDSAAEVDVRLDSKLVVEQMSGNWKIKHPDMRVLAQRAGEIAQQLQDAGGSVSYQWVPRRKNVDADALSNEAMDCAGAGEEWLCESSSFCAQHRSASQQDNDATEHPSGRQ